MKLQITLYVLILCVHGLYATVGEKEHHANGDHHSDVEAQQTSTSKNEDSLLHECQHNSDYQAYIRCLKREKRQHYGSSHVSPEKRSCLDECFETKCESSACIRDCHARCKKRLIETYSKTIETSFDCGGESCSPTSGTTPNITLNVNVTNVLPNVTAGCGYTKSESGNCRDGEKVVNITNVINNVNSPPDCPYPGCNFYPPAIPRITIDISSVPQGGCPYYPSPWPCFPHFQQVQTAPFDCSMCANPFLGLQCNTSRLAKQCV